jgi:dTDP-4-dehydrorhamnose reductase
LIRLLVVGASGLLGHDVCHFLRNEAQVTGTYRDHPFEIDGVEAVRMDALSAQSVDSVVKAARPDVVLMCAAMTGVDACEDQPALADELNHKAVSRVVSALEGSSTKLVSVSTDYVFPGTQTRPYLEIDPTGPRSVYGRTKLLGEGVALKRRGTLVVRVSSLWGPAPREGRDSFATWVVSTLRAGKPVRLFGDQRVTPTYTGAFALLLPRMVQADLSGIYHLAARDCLSRLETGRILAEAFGLDPQLIQSVPLSSAGLKAPRPAMSCLSTGKLERALQFEIGSYADDVGSFAARQGIGRSPNIPGRLTL